MTWFELTFRKPVSHVSHYGLKGPLTFLLVVLSAGCSVGPDYRRTRSCRAGKLAGSQQGGLATGSAELTRWWTAFNDPVLNSLVERADSR
jgi:outer membrane protein, multidrug efflux system